MCVELLNKPEFLAETVASKDMLDGYIRENIQYGFDLSEQFEDVLKFVKQELQPCRDLFTDIELRRIIGTEIAWIRQQKAVAEKCGNVTEMTQARENFINDVRYGMDPALDEDSPLRRMTELETYLRSWRDFPAFGFGVRALEDATGGILPGEICVLTGAPGTMKTSLALSAVDDFVSRTKEGLVYYCSVDMAPREITQRIMERESRIPQAILTDMSGRRDPEFKDIKREIKNKYNGRLAIHGHTDTRQMGIDDLLQACLKRQPQLIVVDYLTRLKQSGQSDLEFVEHAMPKILQYAHQYQASFLLLSQMSRASRSEQASGRIGGHGKGGGVVEELAHTEIELFQQPVDGDKPLVVAAVTKARRGVAGQFFSLDYDGPIKRFSGAATRMKRSSKKKPMFESASFYA
jgi:replicative DNA helicase